VVNERHITNKPKGKYMANGTVMSEGTNGFWFAELDETRDIVFVHISKVKDRKYLHRNDRISFDLETAPDGKLRATNIELIWAAPWQEPKPGVRQ
jgi:cold shock CspA family protein